MSRLPIRVRITMAFALAMLLTLGGAALFVYLRLRADLDEAISASLRSRVAALVLTRGAPSLDGVALEDPEEAFVQLLSLAGKVQESVGTVRGPSLTPADAARAAAAPLTVERHLPGVDGRARLLARATGAPSGDGAAIVVVGQSLNDRNDALGNVISSFAIGGAVAILLASATGYLLATAGLRPVEAMRRRAREVSLSPGEEGLPLPAADDEVRRLGETLNEMLARLRAAFERESRFVADASHELRTPIAVLKIELEGALRLADPQIPAYESLIAATEECDRLAQLAEDLLVLAGSADGRLPLRPEPTGVPPLLTGVRDRFADRAARRGRSVQVRCGPGVVARADPTRLRQVLSNLVDNALRHGQGDVVLSARHAGGGVEIDVSDEGPGFPADMAGRAFERFARGQRARSGEGFGLGLAIVQAIALAHGGHASVVDAPRTTLRVWLPDAH